MKKTFFLIIFAYILFSFLLTAPCSAKQMNILVIPFENTGDKEYSWISAGMTDSVISDLTHIKNISVVSNQDRKAALEEMKFIFSGLAEEDRMIKLGKFTGANLIFTGSYLVSGNRIRVYAKLVTVEKGKVEKSTKIDGIIQSIFDLQDKVVFTLMGETEKITIADIKPIKLDIQDKKKIEQKSKPSVTAYEWYAKGLEIQNTNPKAALISFKKALDIDPNYTEVLIEAGSTAGNTLNLFSEALGYLEKAERIVKGRNEAKSSDYAKVMRSIGLVYSSKGQLDRALEYFLKGQSIYDNLGLQNTTDYAKVIGSIGIVFARKEQLDRALEYFLKGQSIYDNLGLQNTVNYAKLMNYIGNIYNSKGQFDRALEYYLKDKIIEDKLGLQNTVSYAALMYNMALVYEKQSQRDMAGMHYRMAYDTLVRADYSGPQKDEALKNAEKMGH